jgi:hypothetical protein
LIWIAGSSVSIEEGGYATKLRLALAEVGIPLTNLSIGDQTSIMGAMRILSHEDCIGAGDVVIWEYTLLDAMIGHWKFAHKDVTGARRAAWERVTQRRAHVLVVMWPPRDRIAALTPQEQQTLQDALELGFEVIDVRAIARHLRIENPATEYRDDRHPHADSILSKATASMAAAYARSRHGTPLAEDAYLRFANWRRADDRLWRWIGARDLAASNDVELHQASNSLLSVDVIRLECGSSVRLPFGLTRVVAGVLSKHDSGAIGCGHWFCGASGTTLRPTLEFDFLIRAANIFCWYGTIHQITSVRHTRRIRASFNAARRGRTGSVEIFGVLGKIAKIGS